MKPFFKRLLKALTVASLVVLVSGCHVIGAHGAMYLGHHRHYEPAPARHHHYNRGGDYHYDRRYRRSRAHTHERHYRHY